MTTRRQFLQASSALAMTSLAGSAHANRVSALEKTTLGIIGVGKMGRGHLQAMLGKKDVEVVAVCDVVKERLDDAVSRVEKSYAERKKSGDFNGVKSIVDFRELLALPGLDAVLIATPDHWHTIGCILAARAKKHIYCEKPLTHNIAEGRMLVNEVSKANVVFQTGSQQRSEFGGHFRKAVEYVWNGRIGTIKRIRIGVGGPAKACDLPTEEVPAGTNWDLWLGPAPMRGFNQILCPKGVHDHFPAWRSYSEYAGGGLADMGAHHFDIAQWAINMDTSGPTKLIPPKDPATGRGLRYVYANGIEMIHNEFEPDLKADCVFEGTAGMILVSRDGIRSNPTTILEKPIEKSDKHVLASNNHHNNWLAGIRQGTPTICPAEVGHRSASICHLGSIAYKLGRELSWDPASEQFANDADANKLLSREPRPEWRI